MALEGVLYLSDIWHVISDISSTRIMRADMYKGGRNMKIGIEGERTEFKKSTASLNDAIVSMCAILNKHREGILYFGVDDKGNVVSMDVSSETLKKISRRIHEGVDPMPEFHLNVMNDGRNDYIEIPFHGKNTPYSADGDFYIRSGSENRKMRSEQLIDLVRSNSNNEGWERALTKYTADDIDEELLRYCYRSGVESGRIKDEYDKEKLLSKFNLLTDGHLTNAGNCLLSKHEPLILKLAMFTTDERIGFIDLDRFRGNIIECIDEAMLYLRKNMRWGANFSSTVRMEVPEVPIDAIREIVLNSFVHADYPRAANVSHQIDISPSRIRIFNPGRLPADIVPEDSLKGMGKSFLRNPTIAEFLFRSNMIEAFGTGFEKVISLCRRNGTEYEYFNDTFGFSFEFLRKIPYTTESVPIPIGSELEVYKLLKNDDSLTAEIIAKKIGRDIRTVFRKIEALKEKGLIKREGNVRKGYWAVLPAPFDIDTITRDELPIRRRKKDDPQVTFRETDE